MLQQNTFGGIHTLDLGKIATKPIEEFTPPKNPRVKVQGTAEQRRSAIAVSRRARHVFHYEG